MKIYMETLGCPKNFNDTQVAKGIMTESGFELTEYIEEADVMILNTCGFINDAKKESISRTFELAEYKEMGKKLIMTGCLSERYSKHPIPCLVMEQSLVHRSQVTIRCLMTTLMYVLLIGLLMKLVREQPSGHRQSQH